MTVDLPNPANAAKAVSETSRHHDDPAVAVERTVSPSATTDPVNEVSTAGFQGVGRQHDPIDASDGIKLLAGPLLNYRRMSTQETDRVLWHGSVLLVLEPGAPQPHLDIRLIAAEHDAGPGENAFSASVDGEKLYEDPKGAFWAFPLSIPFQSQESHWEYSFQTKFNITEQEVDPNKPRRFWVPAQTEAMRIMFHSCNGFSIGTDVEAWSGQALWNDVLRVHEKRPIHVMIGGGDQIYNDSIRVDGPLNRWTDIRSPIKRRDFPFNEKLRAECDEYYFNNYVKWYASEPFASANCQIPQINIWDDHDIIDGFGSYTDHFMKCPVFRGIGGVAHKYYLLFQHHVAPPKSTFTTDAPATKSAGPDRTAGADAVQLKDTWVSTATRDDPSYIIGKRPGPYVEETSRSLYTQLGNGIALLGIDARTERTRHQVNYPDTYDQIFSRVSHELSSSPSIKHLILLLGIPIAYPRLAWLETILRSPIIGPIRFLNKRFGVAGGFFNAFDGSVDLLDDLDDHYTTHAHKRERRQLVVRLQELAAKFSVRVTILGGDVHLAALGRFFSADASRPAEQDPRYMVNVVSSAITNHPPPAAVANLMARRNKVHRLDRDTHETLLYLWDREPGKQQAQTERRKNRATMPSRNFALITSSKREGTTNGHGGKEFKRTENPREALHLGEQGCGSTHAAADEELRPSGLYEDGLDVTFRVEIDHSDKQGRTRSYGLTIPALTVTKGKGLEHMGTMAALKKEEEKVVR